MLFGSLINGILSGLFNFLNGILSFFFTGINDFILPMLPDVQTAINIIGSFCAFVGNLLAFCLSYFGFTSATLTIISGLIIAIVSIPILVHAIKLGLRWYRILMP